MGCALAIGYLARWIPTWMAITIMIVSCIGCGIVLGKRMGWPIWWGLCLAMMFGIGGAFTGSSERKEAAADELGPVPLSVVIERESHEAFYLKDVKLGEVEYEFTHCGEEDCYDEVLVSIRDKNSAADVPIRHWIQASQDDSFDGQYIFSRISLTYHKPEELRFACTTSPYRCVDDNKASFFEPVLPSQRRQDEQKSRQKKGDDDPFVFLIMITTVWIIPILFGAGRACWRQSLGQG